MPPTKCAATPRDRRALDSPATRSQVGGERDLALLNDEDPAAGTLRGGPRSGLIRPGRVSSDTSDGAWARSPWGCRARRVTPGALVPTVRHRLRSANGGR